MPELPQYLEHCYKHFTVYLVISYCVMLFAFDIPVLLGDRQLGISAHCDLRSVAMVEHQVQLPAEVKGTVMQSPESVKII